MAQVSSKDLSTQLSRRLASFKLSDATVKSLSERLLIDGLTISRFNPCIYGICVDYFTDKHPNLGGLGPKLGVARWEVFPYGILEWDRYRVHVAFNVDELEGRVPREFGH